MSKRNRHKTQVIRHVVAPAPARITRAMVRDAFDPDALKRICEMQPEDFWDGHGEVFAVSQPQPDDFYIHDDRGFGVLGIAHLDYVASTATCTYATTSAGEVVFSGALDDRLGVYVILDLLPKLGVHCDVLLTTGEESGRSTANFFETERQYDWMFQFDRGGTDVVMYDYESDDLDRRIKASGAWTADGSFSDICMLEHLGCKGVNWGVGYRDYHGPRSHAFLEDTFRMVEYFVKFYDQNVGAFLPHQQWSKWDGKSYGKWYDETPPYRGTGAIKVDQLLTAREIEEYTNLQGFTEMPVEDEYEYRSRSILDEPLPDNDVDDILAG